MFTLIIEYQRPRIMYHIDMLRGMLNTSRNSEKSEQPSLTMVSQDRLAATRPPRDLKWTDHEGNTLEFPNAPACESGSRSDSAVTGESLLNVDNKIGSVLAKIQDFCKHAPSITTLARFTPSQILLMRGVMSDSLRIWRSVRHESATIARLYDRFWGQQNAAKRVNVFVTALKYLGRTCLAVETFIEAAEKMPMFRSIQFEAIKPHLSRNSIPVAQRTPLELLERIGFEVRNQEWIEHLQKNRTVRKFQETRCHKRFLHAELQVLNFFTLLPVARDKTAHVHQFIGCSKLCCLLCYCLVLAHGKFKMRGTHRTVMHRWEFPPAIGLGPAANHLYEIVLDLLEGTLSRPFRDRHSVALAQSSAAISTARTVPDQDLGQMEAVQLNNRYVNELQKACKANVARRRMMMMPTITEGGLLVQHLGGKPGYANVMDGSGTIHEMSLSDADILSAEHYRLKLGLEKLDDIPPIRLFAPRTCNRCRLPALLRCSACRTSYCSDGCQHRDWKRHVFVCTVPHRPNAFDHLKTSILRMRMLQDKMHLAKFLESLFADDDLCRTFGFVACVDEGEVTNLLCLWRSMLRDVTNRTLVSNDAEIGDLVEVWAKTRCEGDEEALGHQHCINWFLERRRLPKGFRIPEWDEDYAYQVVGLTTAYGAFLIDSE